MSNIHNIGTRCESVILSYLTPYLDALSISNLNYSTSYSTTRKTLPKISVNYATYKEQVINSGIYTVKLEVIIETETQKDTDRSTINALENECVKWLQDSTVTTTLSNSNNNFTCHGLILADVQHDDTNHVRTVQIDFDMVMSPVSANSSSSSSTSSSSISTSSSESSSSSSSLSDSSSSSSTSNDSSSSSSSSSSLSQSSSSSSSSTSNSSSSSSSSTSNSSSSSAIYGWSESIANLPSLENVVASWSFSENELLTDTIGNNDLDNINSVTNTSSGKIGYGADCDVSSNQYLQIASGDEEDLRLSEASISFWCKAESLDTYQGLVAKACTGGYNYEIQYYIPNGGLRVELYDGTNNPTITASKTFTIGQWYHVVLTIDATYVKIYVDNVQYGGDVSNTCNTSILATAGNFNIGTRVGNPSKSWDGVIDEVTIYNTVLTEDNITALYNDGDGVQLIGS